MKNDLSNIADYYMLPDSSYCFTVNSGYEMQFKTKVYANSYVGSNVIRAWKRDGLWKIENWKLEGGEFSWIFTIFARANQREKYW